MQIYEQYWSYTAAFTDLFGTKAVTSLKICVDFLDVHANDLYTKELYEELQTEIKAILQIDYISIRKAVNQFVKLGFLKPLLAGYFKGFGNYLVGVSELRCVIFFRRLIL